MPTVSKPYIVPQPTDFMSVREQVIPIPSSGDSKYRSALLLGTTGAGKATVLRQVSRGDLRQGRTRA